MEKRLWPTEGNGFEWTWKRLFVLSYLPQNRFDETTGDIARKAGVSRPRAVDILHAAEICKFVGRVKLEKGFRWDITPLGRKTIEKLFLYRIAKLPDDFYYDTFGEAKRLYAVDRALLSFGLTHRQVFFRMRRMSLKRLEDLVAEAKTRPNPGAYVMVMTRTHDERNVGRKWHDPELNAWRRDYEKWREEGKLLPQNDCAVV